MAKSPKSMHGIAAAALSICMIVAAPSVRAGEWAADARSGCQVWNPNPQLEESVTWSGPCASGRAEGHGIAQWSKRNVPFESDEGEWHDGRQINKGMQSWATGRYQGDLMDGEPNGHGVLTVQKLRYEGNFRNGRPNGTGTLTTAGQTVHGIWKDGCLQGQHKAAIGVPLSACR